MTKIASFATGLYMPRFMIAMMLASGSIIGIARGQGRSPGVYRLSPLRLVDDRQVPVDQTALTGSVTLRIAPGQREDLVLALAGGEKGIASVTVGLAPLKGLESSTLVVPAEEVRVVICAYVPTGGINGPPDWNVKEAYQYEPYALMYDSSIIRPNHATWRNEVAYTNFPDDNPPLKPRDVPARELRQWYITIPVPADARPGQYKGSIVFQSGEASIATVALTVDVLPIRLLPPAKLYGIYEVLGLGLDDPRRLWVLKDLAEHGFHNPIWELKCGPDFAVLGKALALSRQAGLDPDYFFISDYSVVNPYAEPPADDSYRKYAEALMTYWKTQSQLPLVMYSQDEATGETLAKITKTISRPLRENGLGVGAACYAGYFSLAGEWMNYPVLAGTLNPEALSKADIAQARAKGATILSYSGPMLSYRDPLLYRLRTGFNLWNNIYDGWCPWVYATSLKQHQDGTVVTRARGASEKAHGVVLVGKNRIIPHVEWPAMREGVDDVRYATTLAAQVLKAKELGIQSPAVEEYATLLRGIGAATNAMGAEAIEQARATVTDAILALQAFDPRLATQTLGGNNPKAVARKVNAWILPDLAFRPFPMGMSTVGEAFVKMRQMVKDGKPFEATMAGYAVMRDIEQAQGKGLINDVESFIAKGEIGPVLVDECERVSLLGKEGMAFTNYLNEVADLSLRAWVFRPDREDRGFLEKWFEPGKDRTGWTPIDVKKMWQEQGNPDWVELEGARIGYMGVGWYALTFEVPKDWAGRKLYLWFTCDEDGAVWVNGKKVRERDEGSNASRWFVPTLAPLTDVLRPGESNTIVVRVYNSQQGGGLWRGVRVLEPKKQ